jgi:DNA repair exonuclease SbcCD ATPase subunit
MRIKFTDFRCYINQTFDFSDNELILISAESGAGKSTILLGIQFCLYGTGSKLQYYGKTSCKVELEFEDMKIVRTKRPNRLVINDLYEDEIAQHIINKKFGDAFNVTSYICQNAINSFILMSPPDKLEFLEKFAFKDVNLPEIKNKSKKLCNDRNEELNKTISQLEIASSILKEINEPVKVEFPFRCKSSDYEKFAKNEFEQRIIDSKIKAIEDNKKASEKSGNLLTQTMYDY